MTSPQPQCFCQCIGWPSDQYTFHCASEKFRLKVAHIHIGKVFAYFPNSMELEMPPKSICRAIDHVNTPSIKDGFRSEVFNQHGASSCGPYEGGVRERRMSEHFQNLADSLILKSPVTASIFEALAGIYRFDAVRSEEFPRTLIVHPSVW